MEALAFSLFLLSVTLTLTFNLLYRKEFDK